MAACAPWSTAPAPFCPGALAAGPLADAPWAALVEPLALVEAAPLLTPLAAFAAWESELCALCGFSGAADAFSTGLAAPTPSLAGEAAVPAPTPAAWNAGIAVPAGSAVAEYRLDWLTVLDELLTAVSGLLVSFAD
jgi:hypothetical protein